MSKLSTITNKQNVGTPQAKPHILLGGELTDLNTYINAERRNRFIGAKIKKQNTDGVSFETTGAPKVITYPVTVVITWYTKNERKDPDNVAFSKKFILDGLVNNGTLRGDTRKEIAGFIDYFITDKEEPRVEINFIPA